MTTIMDRIGVRWEANYPAALAVVCAVAGFLSLPGAFEWIHHKDWALENVFVAIFTLGTVTAGLGLAIYTFLLTTESGFIGRVKHSIYYKHMLTYVLIATFASGLLAVVSIPGMVIKAAPHAYSWHAAYVGIWAGVSGWAAGTLFRAGYIFSIFAREHH